MEKEGHTVSNSKCARISCVTTTMVISNRRLINKINSSNSAATIGSSPAEGSSKMRSSGSSARSPCYRSTFFHAARQFIWHQVARFSQPH